MNTPTTKCICILLPCYNEAENIEPLYIQLKAICATLNNYRFEFLFIDNHSTDNTVALIKKIAQEDPQVKLIVNARNFGHIRSPFYGLLQTSSDATITMASDLQDPPTLIPKLIAKWEEGYKTILATKPKSKENKLMFALRTSYYKLITRFSDTPLIKNFTGFGLYDKKVVDILKTIDDPYPYFRGLIADIGLEITTIEFEQPRRERGITKNNFYTLYDMGMLGMTSHTKIPLRLATLGGFLLSAISMLIAIIYLLLKLIFWNQFSMGVAPILIGVFFFSSIQLFFIGLLGEYITAIHTQVLKRPLVIEEERVNC